MHARATTRELGAPVLSEVAANARPAPVSKAPTAAGLVDPRHRGGNVGKSAGPKCMELCTLPGAVAWRCAPTARG
eukprot:11035589-Alexandrium_andersonii.AAC.1